MTTAILDTNVVLQAVISSPTAASARTLDALYEGRFQLVYSTPVLEEWLDALTIPRIQRRHGLNDDEILEFVASLLVNARDFPGQVTVTGRLIRDLSDTKFLSLTAESKANYLVTNDRRHLLPLKKFQSTQVVTPSRFLRHLRSQPPNS